MGINRRHLFLNILASVICIFLFIPEVSSYDGPAGVTFRAPFISGSAGSQVFLAESIAVRVKVRIDNAWSMKVEGKGRAFPDQFIATIADSEITFSLRNQGRKGVKTNVLIPFDSSNTVGTGFTEPFSLAAFVDGKSVAASRGPDLARGMFKVRSYRVAVEIPAGSTISFKITASHPLAVHPAWYQFICSDQDSKFPDFRSLTKDGCSIDFEFDPSDEKLKEKPLIFEYRKTLQKELFSARKIGKIKFSDDSIQWVRVDRLDRE